MRWTERPECPSVAICENDMGAPGASPPFGGERRQRSFGGPSGPSRGRSETSLALDLPARPSVSGALSATAPVLLRRRATDLAPAGAVDASVAASQDARSAPSSKSTPADRAAFFDLHFHPLLIVDRQGCVLDANAAARADIRDGRIGLSNDSVLRLGSRDCARRFQAVMADLAPEPAQWRRLVIRMTDGEWRLARIRHLPQLPESVLVELQPSIADQDTDLSALAQAFALTNAETAVLANLLEAQAPKEIARALGISSHTVRAHMRAIYAKLGVRARSGMMKAALRLIS